MTNLSKTNYKIFALFIYFLSAYLNENIDHYVFNRKGEYKNYTVVLTIYISAEAIHDKQN